MIIGPELLDRALPAWYNQIDLAKLDMFSPYNCILGQLYGTFRKGFDRLRLGEDNITLDQLVKTGFFESTGDEMGEWQEAIRIRKGAINVEDYRRIENQCKGSLV